MERKIKVKLTVSTNTRLYYYTGYIVSKDEEFYTFDDRKLGIIKINKDSVLTVQEVQ